MAKEPKLEIDGKSQWHGSDVGMVQMNGMEVARTQQEWCNIWEFRRGCFTPQNLDLTPGKLPEGAMAIAMFVPGTVTRGCSIQIKKIEETGDKITVDWFLLPAGTKETDNSAFQFVVRLVPYSNKGVEFRQVPAPEMPPPQLNGPGM